MGGILEGEKEERHGGGQIKTGGDHFSHMRRGVCSQAYRAGRKQIHERTPFLKTLTPFSQKRSRYMGKTDRTGLSKKAERPKQAQLADETAPSPPEHRELTGKIPCVSKSLHFEIICNKIT
jgi:hypothetical protein